MDKTTVVLCPGKFLISRSVAMSHNLISPYEPETILVPSGLIATEVISLSCPGKFLITCSVAISHNLIVLSHELDTNCVPSLLKATALTTLVCPENIFLSPVALSQSII